MQHKKYTRQQIVNYLTTGDVNNSGPITDVAGVRSRTLDFAIQHNPTAAYALLKKKFGHGFPIFLPGAEFTPQNQQSMSNFLQRKLSEMSESDATAFAASFAALPHDPKNNNWTNPID